MTEHTDYGEGNSLYNHVQIIKSLRQTVQENKKETGCEIFQSLEEIPEIVEQITRIRDKDQLSIDPNLPVDLVCVDKKKEKDDNGKFKEFPHYTIFMVASTETDFPVLERRILFYKFYLSRIISSKRLMITLVAPEHAIKGNEKFFVENGIGFWRFVEEEDTFEELNLSLSLRDLMEQNYEKSAPENTPLFFDTYIHDSVNAIAGIRFEQFGERFLDRRLMDKIFELENISYRGELFELINEQLTTKDDEYIFVSEVFHKLWKQFIGIPYTDFLEKFDPVLQNVFAGKGRGERIYRDHYLHQFQVFLLGLYIIDKKYESFAAKYKSAELSWLMISSFHDMTYPVQLYDKWSRDFFEKVFKVSKELASIDLKSNFVEQSFMACTACIVARLCSVFLQEELRGNWIADKSELVHFFYERIVEAKNHCILSSVCLLKMMQEEEYKQQIKVDGMDFETIFKEIIEPTALAIAIHDTTTWQMLKKMGYLPVLKFDEDPLSFLLIFCDSIQEWGRPSKSLTGAQEQLAKRFYLKSVEFESDGDFNATIWTPYSTKTEPFFISKQQELRDIQSFLKQPTDTKFRIRLEDKEGQGEDFTMQGLTN